MEHNPSVLPSLVLFARVPAPGVVKTRLVPALSEAEAARLYLAFLEDAARTYVAVGAWTPVLAADPDAEDPVLASLFAPPWRRETQSAGDLGDRLTAAFEREFSRGAGSVLTVGSDHPALPRRLLQEAFGRLAEDADAAVVPAEDGGYCAIGLRSIVSAREVFREIPWSSPSVLAVTYDRMRALDLRVATLESGYDVDRPEDIGRLRRDLASRDSSSPDYPQATARALAGLSERIG